MDKLPRAAFVAAMHTSILALLDGLGGPELVVIGLVVLLLFGSKRMPEIGRGLGRTIREFKRATSSVEENIREVLYEEPARPKLRPPAQRRPFRDTPTGTPAPVSDVAAAPAPPAAPAAPASDTGANLNEPAPRETPPAAEEPTRPDDTARHGDNTTDRF